MKIAIISDIHDNITNLKKFLNWCKEENVIEIICCGDVTNGKTLQFLADNFSGTIYLIRGNLEIYDESQVEKYKNIKYYGRFGIADIENIKVGLCHEPWYLDKVLDKSAIVFYGHTHRPWIEERKGKKIINPGTLGGVFTKGSFATWDTENNAIDLKLVELI